MFNSSLRSKLQWNSFFILSICLFGLMLISNALYTESIDNQANEHALQMLGQARATLDATLQTYDNVIMYLSQSDEVKAYLSLQGTNTQERVRLETSIRKDSLSYFENTQGINGIVIASEQDIYISNHTSKMARYPIVDDPWYVAAKEADGALTVTSPIGRNLSIWGDLGTSDITTLSRSIIDETTGEVLGVISVDILIETLANLIGDVTLGKQGYIFLMDATENILTGPENDTVYRLRNEWFIGGDDEVFRSIGGEIYQIMHSRIESTGWIIGGVFPYGELLAPIERLRFVTIALLFFTTIIASLWIMRFSALFTRPISRIRSLMQQAESGNLDVRYEGSDAGEIAQLGNSFNAMIDNIQTLFDMVYKEQRAKRDAELKTLQAQIKPHFLYNTLDTIRYMAEENDADDVTAIVDALTRLFRISLSKGADEITLEDELMHTDAYLYIQKVRYEDKLEFQIHCPPDLKGCFITKLILQPLVENAIYHGTKQKEGGGRVDIYIIKHHNELMIRVVDDGVGMSREKMRMLNDKLDKNASGDSEYGYGIFNVNNRVKFTYGMQYGLEFEENEFGGVTSVLRLPHSENRRDSDDSYTVGG